MIRALIDRDNNTLRDCSSKWPTQDRQPYYALEKSFTDQKVLLPYNVFSQGFGIGRDRSGTNYPYIYKALEVIYATRRYNFQLHQVPFNGEYPIYFRQHREFIMDNRRHDRMTCDMYDVDPLTNDMSVMSITGTGLGADFRGEWNTVSHRTPYGSFRGEINEQGNYPEVVRKSVKDFPEHATNVAPGSTYKSHQLQYIALDNQYCVFRRYSQFVPNKINFCVLENGIASIHVRALTPIRVEALFSPAAHYLTQEPVTTDMVNVRQPNGENVLTKVPINSWAPIRSIDNCYSFGAMTGRSKCKMAEAAGHGMNVILETENRHLTYLQCPEKVRKGQNGQFCDKFNGSLVDLKYLCIHCSERNQLVDSQHGSIYSFACSTIAKGSLILGERAPNDTYCDAEDKVSAEEKQTTYGLMPNQVPQNLYRHLEDDVGSISRVPIDRQCLGFVLRNSNQFDHLRVLKEIVQWSETEQGRPWDTKREGEVFEDTRIRTAGFYDGYPRRTTYGDVREPEASPGQILWPGVTLKFTTLSNRTYIRVLGCLGLILLISRPIPTIKEYTRNETYLGRFVNSNLFAMTWTERMYQVEDDKDNKILDWVLMKFFQKPLYTSVIENDTLYR